MSAIEVPFPGSYWVIPGMLLAGEYPGSLDDNQARAKIRGLARCGIRHIIDLTSDLDPLKPYDSFLREIETVGTHEFTREKRPILDLSIPTPEDMTVILDAIDRRIAADQPVYVHCWGGIGRTGTVIGCYLVRHGLSGREALRRIAELRRSTPDGWRQSPETPEQREMVLNWRECGRDVVQSAPVTAADAVSAARASGTIPDRIMGGLLGLAVGDALGVPVEFEDRSVRKNDPVTGMRGYCGRWRQPPGTWSDDTSMTLCTTESLIDGYDPARIAESFVRWVQDGHWTSWGEAFDIGTTTRRAISRLAGGAPPLEAGDRGEHQNGNGSLMRILPVALYFSAAKRDILLNRLHEASSITHAHPRSMIACGIYGLLVVDLLKGREPLEAYRRAMAAALQAYGSGPMNGELRHFARLTNGDIHTLPEVEIRSSGYVVDTLEASIWCLLTTGDYRSAVLKAVNLGDDTDTTGAVTGGLAGVYYGLEAIPAEWLDALARRADVEELARRFAGAVEQLPCGDTSIGGALSWIETT